MCSKASCRRLCVQSWLKFLTKNSVFFCQSQDKIKHSIKIYKKYNKIIGKTVNINQNEKPEIAVNNQVKVLSYIDGLFNSFNAMIFYRLRMT